MQRIFTFLLILSGYLMYSQSPIAVWPMDETTGLLTKETVSGNNFSVKNDYPKMEAEWLPAASANGLRCNGYATWVEGNLTTTMPVNQVSITAWVAPEVWPMSTAAIFTNVSFSGGGAYLGIDKFGRLEIGATVNGFFTKKTSTEKIPFWQWSLLSMTVDTNEGKLRGYLNGVLIVEQITAIGTLTWATPNTVKIGKFHTQTMLGIYETGLFCGLIDEVRIFDTALTVSELGIIFQDEMPSTLPNLTVPASRFDGDLHRPIYHAIPPANWMNEPHGLIFYNNQYHNFYQKNGSGPYWGRLNWGHQVSPDLVTWTEQKTVLAPDPDTYDKEGCWSGSSFAADGKAFIIYTGVDGATAQMCLAEANTDASEYQKILTNPVVLNPPAPYTTNDFRDPYIWEENGIFYMIIGTGNGTGGAALMYKSTDYNNWQYLYPIKKGVQTIDQSGFFWELPSLLTFGNKRVFTAQPTPQGAPARILYWTGTFENEYFTADSIKPKLLEPGNALLGVTTTTDPQGNVIAIGIIPDMLPDYEQRKNGWANLMSLPRVWSLSADGGTLLQKPLPALEKLRGEHQHYDNSTVSENQTGFLPNTQGRHLELRTRIDPGTATKVGIILAKSDDNSEYTRVYWDVLAHILVIDRIHSSISTSAPSTFLTTPIEQNGQPLDLHMFLDGSVLEVFINDEKALSTRIYPEKISSIGLDLYAIGGTATFQNVDTWQMKNMHDPSVTAVESTLFLKKNTLESVFPNPTNGTFAVNINLAQPGNVKTRIVDIFGKTLDFEDFGEKEIGKTSLIFRQNELPSGAYFIQIFSNQKIFATTKIFKF
jgi:sucrose-6-phosphate hydrolase SacC (GH32 family)